ncbi:MAG: alpha-2-macroglobulin family protein, partial [Pseudomonadota bacterium]|nr:alpha-2-macroglobulin family protein [Pseudomonadota bacterium]
QITALIQQQSFEHQHPQTQGFQFDVYQENVDEAPVHQSQAQLDQQGQLHSQFTLPAHSPVVYGQLLVETAVRDDRGKDVTERVKARYLGRDRFVGLKTEQWLFIAGQPAQVQLLVVDEHGQPVTDTPINVEIKHLETQAARVKGAGNAYLTQYQHQWRAVDHCQLQGEEIPSSCGFVPPKAGDYKITAQVEDSYGQPHTTKLQQWAVGGDHVVWETSPGNGLTLQPEQQQYQVGDTARYVVKNPYPGAQALVTVERLGILKSWVTTLKDSVAVVEVPVEADYVPGFFVSVMIMSPRVDKPINQQQVDLGKPAFRMGYVKTTVVEPYKQLKVKVKTDKTVYRPRQQVTVNLQVYNHHHQVPKQPVELAISVLDEAVLDLLTQGRRYFDPYRGFYTLDRLDMANFSLLMRLVGRQKFEKKGANAGGDGGGSLGMRSLFKFVSYWNPSLTTDEQGQAQIQFQVPDNLTGWRILAMAVTPGEQMGLGEGHFKVNQPIEIRPVLPNHLIQGDSLHAGFNIMNRSEQLRQLEVLLAAQGPLELEPCPSTLTHCGQQQMLQATPFQRYNVWLPLKTHAAGVIEFKAQAHDDQVADQLHTTLTVHKRRSLMTAASYGSSTDAQIQERIQFPKAMHTDVGQVEVTVAPSLIGGLEGAFAYMRDYPYSCWEQKLSKAMMAAHYQNFQDYLPSSFSWQASQQLPEDMLAQAAEYQAPNGGMAYYIADEQRVDPYLSAYTALLFNGLRSSGYAIPDNVENKLHDYLLKFLRQDVMPSFYAKGMAASVRAVTLAALAPHNKITRADLQRYQPHLQHMDLWGQAHFLQAALTVPQTKSLRQTVIENLLGHMEQTTGKVVFQEQLANRYKHILSSQLRTQCAILSGFMAYSDALPATVADIPLKLVRQISATRKSQGHWHNTQENIFCLQALTDYQRRYEQQPPQMTLHTWLDEAQLGSVELTQRTQPPQSFSHALTESDPGRQAQVKITREGQGRWYYSVRLQYAPTSEQAQAIDAGIEVKREYHVKRAGQWQLLNTPLKLETGELVRVDLYVSVAGSRHFVVVDDPIPGGLEPVNRQLATAAKIATTAPQAQDFADESYWHQQDSWQTFGSSFWNFYHKELRHQAARFYADYLPPGDYHLTYVAQVIAAGDFQVMPTHAEEMYDPEVYGKGLPAQLIVRRQMQ